MMMVMMISPEISNPIHESYSLIDAKLLYHKLLVGGWANPSEKYEFVSWDDEIPNIWKNNIHVPNHQPG